MEDGEENENQLHSGESFPAQEAPELKIEESPNVGQPATVVYHPSETNQHPDTSQKSFTGRPSLSSASALASQPISQT